MCVLKRKCEIAAVMLGLACMASACSKEKPTWAAVKVEPEIVRNPVYQDLNKQLEVFNATELLGRKQPDSTIRRTSGVKYSSGNPADLNKDEYGAMNNCRAYFYESDTLLINIGLGDGFGGKGFIIRYKNGKFNVEPYLSTDVIIEGAPEPTYKIVYQDVTLDKSSYAIGDSLFGKVDFKAIEHTTEGSINEHIGKGYFRTLIGKL